MTTIDFWALGPLRRVDRWVFLDDSGIDDNWLIAVEFGFAEGAVAVEAVPDDDTVSVHAATGVLTHWAGESVRLAADHPAVGLGVRWAWLLTNHQGYMDGFQIEFAFDGASIPLQFVAQASRLVEFDVTERAAAQPTEDTD
ncbi:MAG: DUF6334 family protein [Microthrixaceae bacterium]|nr:DUF6334 family protein [Microthrixaceae bacterium]